MCVCGTLSIGVVTVSICFPLENTIIEFIYKQLVHNKLNAITLNV